MSVDEGVKAEVARGYDLVILGATPRYVGQRAYFGATADRVLADAPCAVAVYAGGVRPEALRAAVPDASTAADARAGVAGRRDGGSGDRLRDPRRPGAR